MATSASPRPVREDESLFFQVLLSCLAPKSKTLPTPLGIKAEGKMGERKRRDPFCGCVMRPDLVLNQLSPSLSLSRELNLRCVSLMRGASNVSEEVPLLWSAPVSGRPIGAKKKVSFRSVPFFVVLTLWCGFLRSGIPSHSAGRLPPLWVPRSHGFGPRGCIQVALSICVTSKSLSLEMTQGINNEQNTMQMSAYQDRKVKENKHNGRKVGKTDDRREGNEMTGEASSPGNRSEVLQGYLTKRLRIN